MQNAKESSVFICKMEEVSRLKNKMVFTYMMCSGSFESPEGCGWEGDSSWSGSAYALQDIQHLRPCPLKVCSNPRQ